MQFDQCIRNDHTALEMIDAKYEEAGYVRPNVVFWNLRDAGNVPVKFDQTGTALVSGFAPAILGTVLESFKTGKILSPENIMLDAVMKDRYDL